MNDAMICVMNIHVMNNIKDGNRFQKQKKFVWLLKDVESKYEKLPFPPKVDG